MESVAIVMPVHNEGESIEETISEIMTKVVSKMDNVQLFVWEDGSTDGTKEKLRQLHSRLAGTLNVKTSPERKGYPRAAREAIMGVDLAYDYILFMDSDGQYDPNDFFAMWAERNNADFVVGARKNRAEAMYRRILSRGLNSLIRSLFRMPIRDVTSAFRLMRRPLAQVVAESVKFSKHNFWSEFTARSGALKVRVLEVPVQYRSRVGGSKVYRARKMPRIVWDEFIALVRTRRELLSKV